MTESPLRYQPEKLPQIVCPEHPEWVAMYNTAWQMAFSNIEYPTKPGWKPQLTCMPGADTVWQWDSCFMTFFTRFSNRQLSAMDNLDNLYRLQREDGFASMAYRISTERPAYGERINPPLFSWAEWEYYLATGDDSRLESVLPRLVRLYDWIQANRTRNTGLYWFEDSGSSGMDNAPRGGYLCEKLNGSDICFIDLACQQALSALYIGKIAGHLGNTDLVERFAREHTQLKALINERHWCERIGFYMDLFTRDHKDSRCNFLNHKTLAGYWPMISEVANEGHVGRLIEHLLNPDEFWTRHPLPTLSKDDPNYDPLGGYWLGGVWAPTNYMVIKGLERYKKHDLAREIAVRHLNAMVEVMREENYASIWECYSPEFARPATNGYGRICRPDFVGWTGLGPIAMLIESIFGFQFDASDNRISWMVRTTGEHGIRNLVFNGKTVSLTIAAADAIQGTRKVTVETTGPVRLELSRLGKFHETQHELSAGRHELLL